MGGGGWPGGGVLGGGILAWVFAGPGWDRLSRVTDWLNEQEVGGQVAALLGTLVVVVGFGAGGATA